MAKSKLLALDAFAKTVEDAKVRTSSGGFVTIGCLLTIILLVLNEWSEFNTVQLHPEIVVDRDRNKRLDINLDLSFPKLPCDILTLDIMDVSGEIQTDIHKVGFTKIRLSETGREISEENLSIGNDDDTDFMLKKYGPDYCGSCYGAKDQDRNKDLPQDQKVCCNSCESLKKAYVQVGWAFYDGVNTDQCEQEGYVKRINDRIKEGCRIRGTANINRIAGNLHIAPGASFTVNSRHSHDVSLYDSHEHFSFEHIVNHLSFGVNPLKDSLLSTKKNSIDHLMLATSPLDGYHSKPAGRNHVYTYFIKVVSTRYEYLSGKFVETNQFSATKHDRPLMGGKDEDHQHTVHASGGHSGVFLNLEISPLKVINREEYDNTWGSFVLSICSAIGGVLTIGAVIDRMIYETDKVIRQKKDS